MVPTMTGNLLHYHHHVLRETKRRKNRAKRRIGKRVPNQLDLNHLWRMH
jgi:hypothetical protein